MKVHFIKKTDDSYVMFLSESLRFYNVNDVIKHLVEAILSGMPKEKCLEAFNISDGDYDKIARTLDTSPVDNFTAENEHTLYKLVLNVTNTCNLNCKYCYADGGNYSSLDGMMNIETARAAIDLFYSKYRSIRYIQFFGGEPLLNEPVIRFACEYITNLYNTGKIDSLPEFGTISNGTVFSEKLSETIKKYNITITLSIDGPQVVHDSLRVYKNGIGSFSSLTENIKKYAANSIVPVAAEATYSSVHEENGLSVLDTVKYIKDELSIPNVHVVPVSGTELYELRNRDSFSDSIGDIFAELSTNKKDYSYSLVSRIVMALKRRGANKYLCEAGISIFSVSHTGDIYPCFMLTGEQQFLMGNVYSGISVFEDQRFLDLRNTLKAFSKYENEQCKDCFNNRICAGCLGMNYFNCGDIACTADKDCRMQKELTEKVLLELSNQLK